MRAPTLRKMLSHHPRLRRRSQFKIKARPSQNTTKITISSISLQTRRRSLITAEETTGAMVEMAAAEAAIVEPTTANPEEATVAVVEEAMSTEMTNIREADMIKGTSSSRDEEAATTETNTAISSSTPTTLIITRRTTKKVMEKETTPWKRDSSTSQNRMALEAEDVVGTMGTISEVGEIRTMANLNEEGAQQLER